MNTTHTHVEFPDLTPEAAAALHTACAVWQVDQSGFAPAADRRALAAFLLEAMKQADPMPGSEFARRLAAIAANLHNPSPPPPTLDQAREAARQLGGENAAIVHAFLATLVKTEASQ